MSILTYSVMQMCYCWVFHLNYNISRKVKIRINELVLLWDWFFETRSLIVYFKIQNWLNFNLCLHIIYIILRHIDNVECTLSWFRMDTQYGRWRILLVFICIGIFFIYDFSFVCGDLVCWKLVFFEREY